MLRNLRCKGELGLPLPTSAHTYTHIPLHLSMASALTYAPTKPVLHSNTHKSTFISNKCMIDLPCLIDTVYTVGHTHLATSACTKGDTNTHVRMNCGPHPPLGWPHSKGAPCGTLFPLAADSSSASFALSSAHQRARAQTADPLTAFPLVYRSRSEMDAVCLL